MHWNYIFLALTHRYKLVAYLSRGIPCHWVSSVGCHLWQWGSGCGSESLTLAVRRHWSHWLAEEHTAEIEHTGINSLAPGKFEWNFRYVIFKWISVIDGWGISCEIAIIRISLDFTYDQSILVQVMAWCRQATSHYLSQCWPRSPTIYGAIGPQWVN